MQQDKLRPYNQFTSKFKSMSGEDYSTALMRKKGAIRRKRREEFWKRFKLKCGEGK